MTWITSFVFTAMCLVVSLPARAQILPRENKDSGLEDLYDQFENQEDKAQERVKNEDKKRQSEAEKKTDKELSKLSELSVLAPFDDIAVIQRKFLPKTGRFEFSGSALLNTNNQYFNNIGAALRGAYFFQEKYGVEATAMFITSSERPITEGLVDNQNIETRSLVQPKGYYGINFKWAPLYGKMAWFQNKIVPFDLYFTPGFGMTSTKDGGSNATLSLGMGQLFALAKSYGVRWDLTWNYYATTVTVEGAKQDRNQSDIYLGIGFSYFIPEATYR
jgi:outer membrane beta-barrel protein